MPSTPLETVIRSHIQLLREGDFQDFVQTLMLHRYGVDGFEVVRRSKDQGSDGIIMHERKVLACWAPGLIDSSKLKRAFEKKAMGDFKSYRDNWEHRYENWQFVMARDPSPNEIKFIDGLKTGSPILGCEKLINIILYDLSSSKRRATLKQIGIPDEFIGRDFLSGFLEDILNSSEISLLIVYKSPTYLPEKVELNFLPCEIDSIMAEIEELQDKYFPAIHDSYQDYEDKEKTRIKSRIRADYNGAKGSTLSEKISSQIDIYLHKYKDESDDEFREIIRAVIFHEFENCLFGIRAKGEQASHDTTASRK